MDNTERLKSFRRELSVRSASELVEIQLASGDCHALTSTQYTDLKIAVGKHFQQDASTVVVVGSAKLGFSLVPEKRYRLFGDESDIDIALVSSTLFDSIWKDVFDFRQRNTYWSPSQFRKYLFRGWIRPDVLPRENFQLSASWWEFFRQLTSSNVYGHYKIQGGVYKDWSYLRAYQSITIEQCQQFEGQGGFV